MRKSTSYAELMHQSSQNQHSRSSIFLANSNLMRQSKYRACNRSHSRGFSFGSSPRNSFMAIHTEGPAPKYVIPSVFEINLQKKKGPSISLGRSDSVERCNLSYLKSNLNPGPGAYKSENSNVYKSNQNIKIGRKNNELLSVEFLNDKAIKDTPGPAAYQAKVIKLKGGKMKSTATRFNCNKENYPGPGAYQIENLEVASCSKYASTMSISLVNSKVQPKRDSVSSLLHGK